MGEEQHHVTPIQRSETEGRDLTNTPELSRRKRQIIIGPILAGVIDDSATIFGKCQMSNGGRFR